MKPVEFDATNEAHIALSKKAQVFDRLVDGQTLTFDGKILVIEDIIEKEGEDAQNISYLALGCNSTKGFVALSNFTKVTATGQLINPKFGLTEFKQLATDLTGQTLTVKMVEKDISTKWNKKLKQFDAIAKKAVPYFIGVGQNAID